jgi:hypothetical protein
VEISSVTGGSVALSGPIADTGLGIRIDGNSGGTFTLSGTSKVVNTGASPAVTLSSNTGATIAFTGGGLDIDVTTASGFSATGGGTVTVEGAGNSVAATTGTPVTIENTTIGANGVSFVRVAADGGVNGIVVDDTGAGPFAVTGTGTTDGSGGTLTNLTSDAVVLNATGEVTLANMVIGDPAAVAGEAPDPTNFVWGAGISATDVTGSPGLTITNVLISRTASHGVEGVRLTGLAVSNSEILNAGDAISEDAMRFGEGGPDGLFGTATVTNTVLDGYVGSGIQIDNSSGSVELTVSGATIGNNQTGISGGGIGQDGLRLIPRGTSTFAIRVDGGTSFTDNQGEAIFSGPRSSASLDLLVDGVSVDDVESLGGSIGVFADDTSNSRVQVTNSTFEYVAGSAIWLQASGSSTIDGTLVSNTVGTAALPASGALAGAAIRLRQPGTGQVRHHVESNVLHSQSEEGIESINSESGGAGDIDSHIVIINNTVTAPETAGFPGIYIEAGNDHGLCADVTGNTSAGPAFAEGIEVLQSGASVFEVVGLGVLAVDAYLAGANTSTAASLGGTFTASPGACTAPLPPTVP